MADSKSDVGRTVLAMDVMTTPVLTIRKDATVSEAAAMMLVNRVGSIVVIEDNGDYAGILTEPMLLPEEALIPFMRNSTFRILGHEVGDFENIEETMNEVRGTPVGTVMNKDNPTASPDTHVGDITEQMVLIQRNHICILENKKPVGMLSRHDLLRLYLNPAGDPVRRQE